MPRTITTRLNLSDIPESTPAELRRARRVGRPATGNAKQLIAIRIAPNSSANSAAWPPDASAYVSGVL